MRGVAVTVLVVGLAVAVTVVICRRKSEASDRGIESSDGSVLVGKDCLSERGATFWIEGRRERRASGCDSEERDPPGNGGKGGMTPDTADRSKLSIWLTQCSLYVPLLRVTADVDDGQSNTEISRQRGGG